MFRKPGFWVALTLGALVSAVVALRLFPLAFPILQLDLRMDRQAALEAARQLAAREGVGPGEFREAASFSSDAEAQTFVELAGGGKDVYAAMLREGLYEAHTWQVRHFREGQKHEALIRFRPDGRVYGFVEQKAETDPGAALSPEEARGIAEGNAVRAWLADLPPFTLVEQSREQRPQGRVDHTFTYERAAPTLNEGRYRLRLVVTGDRLTEVTHFIKVPEAFSRRYEEMRSANEAIGAAGSIAMVVLYLIGGVGVGLFWLLRHRWVIARPAIAWGVAVAFLQLLAAVNEYPLIWMTYDTALPRGSFISQQVASLVASFAGFSTLFAFSFMAAESLSRRAFGHHPQLWRVWSREAAASKEILGQTVAGLLLVAVFFAYDILLYYYATRLFGWWTPSEALIHPDILATYLPWLSAIANSFQAGFWEEALFRAVPIAGAALIGDRFGRRRAFIVAAFIIQTIVFGAGHAPYPTQPSYARPVELILPSIGFGLIYLRFGLLPGIVLHYVFDVVWMAMPLFVSTASGIWIDRAMVVLLTLVPLWMVALARLRTGRWLTLAPEDRNAAWTPKPAHEPTTIEAEPSAVVPVTAPLVRMWLVAGVAGFVIWLIAQPARAPVPPLDVPRAEAERIAREALAARGVDLGPEWRVMPVVDSGRGEAHDFVWEVAGSDRFRTLLGRYLPTPRWRVRIARFEGDIADRAEEWAVLVNHRGEAERIAHQLPESRAGAALTADDARQRAIAEIERVLQVPASSLREVSAQPAKLSARTDWTLAFQDLTVDPILLRGAEGGTAAATSDARGEARIEVVIAGDEIARVRPFLHLPESWQRERRARQTLVQIVTVLSTLLAGGALAGAAIAGIIAWSRRQRFARSVLFAVFAVFALVSLAAAANRVPAIIATLSTARPFDLQLAMLLGVGLIGLLVPGAMVALAAGTLPDDMPRRRGMTDLQAWILGACVGIVAAAAAALVRLGGAPAWPDVGPLGAYVPLTAWSIDRLPSLLVRAVTLTALLAVADDFTDGWTRRRVTFGTLLVIAGALLGSPPATSSLAEWAGGAAIAGALLLGAYVLLLRYDLSLTVVAIATTTALAQGRDAITAGTGAATAGLALGLALTGLTAWWFFRLLRRARDRDLSLG